MSLILELISRIGKRRLDFQAQERVLALSRAQGSHARNIGAHSHEEITSA